MIEVTAVMKVMLVGDKTLLVIEAPGSEPVVVQMSNDMALGMAINVLDSRTPHCVSNVIEAARMTLDSVYGLENMDISDEFADEILLELNEWHAKLG